jgi:hypothetical protein
VARFIRGERDDPDRADAVWARVNGRRPDLSGGYRYRQLERMPYCVNKDAYTTVVNEHIELVSGR